MKKVICFFVVIISLFDYVAFSYAKEINLISANSIIDNLKRKIENDPANVEDRIELGVFYFQLQEYSLAKQYFEEVLSISDNNAIGRYNLGKTLIVLGETERGIAECEKALELGLDDINVYKTLSVEYFDKRDLRKSLAMYRNIQRLEPWNDNAYYATGIIYIGLRDGWKARKEFEKAIEINPNNAEAHYEIGWLSRDYDPQKSKAHYQKVLELNPSHVKAKEEFDELIARRE